MFFIIIILTLIAIYYILQSMVNTIYDIPEVGVKMMFSSAVVFTLMMYMMYIYIYG